jgi:hypothetical protein
MVVCSCKCFHRAKELQPVWSLQPHCDKVRINQKQTKIENIPTYGIQRGLLLVLYHMSSPIPAASGKYYCTSPNLGIARVGSRTRSYASGCLFGHNQSMRAGLNHDD